MRIIKVEHNNIGEVQKAFAQYIEFLVDPEYTYFVVNTEETLPCIVEVEKLSDVIQTTFGDDLLSYLNFLNNNEIEVRIANLSYQLELTGKKVLDNMEASMAEAELPYNPVELHKERQSIRNSIDELSSKISQNAEWNELIYIMNPQQ